MPLDVSPKPGKLLTWHDILDRLMNDPAYPSGRRAFDASRVKKALAWNAAPTFAKARSPVKQPSTFLDRPFNDQTIDELFDELRAADLRLAAKTLENARSICKFVADFYAVPRGIGYTPFSNECDRLLSMVPSKWDRRALRPGLHYLSYALIDPWEMTQAHVQKFETSLHTEFPVAEPRELFNEFTRVWNKCAATIPGWPPLIIIRNVVLKKCAINWDEYAELKKAIDNYLARGRRFEELELNADDEADDDDDLGVVVPLAGVTARGHVGSLGLVVWALRKGGIRSEQLVTLRDLCIPERYRLAMRELTTRAGGVVNRTVHARLVALARVAEAPNVLTEAELKVTRKIRAQYEHRFREFLRTYEERDQKTLDHLDDPSVMDALLALPMLTKRRVLAKRSRHSIGCAYAIQRALILELWMCAPYRIGAFASIELEQIISMRLDSVERVLLRKAKKQSVNKKAPEHLLNTDTIELLRLYIDEYRPLILKHNGCERSPHLFPGKAGAPKHTGTLREQMNRFVRKHTSLQDWHPHIVRKVSPKIALDADPGNLEVARRTGGWADDRMLRDVYTQRVHRASQSKYLELLESRRLHSTRAFGKPRRPKKPPLGPRGPKKSPTKPRSPKT